MRWTLMLACVGSFVPGADPEGAIRIASEMLAKALGVPARRIVARDVRHAEWRDASLGCPDEGVHYAEEVTTGYRLRLEAGGKSYTVHVAGQRAVLCSAPPGIAGKKGLGADEVAAMARLQSIARDHLARRLGVDRRKVRARSVRRVLASLGNVCAGPAAAPMSSDTATGASPAAPAEEKRAAGWMFELQSAGRSYRYFGTGQHVMPCDGREPGEGAGKPGEDA